MKNKIQFIAIVLLFNFLMLNAQDEITIKELKQHVSFLANDKLEGRKSGSEGGILAAEYIQKQFDEYASLMGENGFQFFEVVTDVKLGEKNHLSFADVTAEIEKDFMPYPYSMNAEISAEVVFVGYGLEISNDDFSWNSYQDLDVNGKWVLMFKGDPENDKDESHFMNYSSERDKVLTARDKGASGVLFVSGKKFDESDKLVSLFFDKTSSNAGLPVINIKRELADKILNESSKTALELETQIDSFQKVIGFNTNTVLKASSEISQQKVRTQNVVAIIEGSDPILKEEYIVIGAHYDHLGLGGIGSGSRVPDTLAPHNGADDNATGVASIIEMGEKLSADKSNLKRSIVLIAFDAEEMGLLGSKYFTSNSLIDLDKVQAMFNFDMVGRLNDETQNLMINGTGTSVETEEILNKMSENTELNFAYSPEGYGPSDHAAFYSEDIPVFFISTGAHPDYHTPNDDFEFINFEGQKLISDFSYDLVYQITNRTDRLTFKEAGPKARTRGGNNLKVTLGIMPDFTSTADYGLGVGGVTPGRPANNAGILKGDRIVAIDGKAVENIYDYMGRLKKLELGQIITVDIIRNDEKIVLLVQL